MTTEKEDAMVRAAMAALEDCKMWPIDQAVRYAVRAALAAPSASAQQAVRAFSKDVCADDVFDRGESIGLFDIPKEAANAICAGITAATGALVDWHYVGGRVHMKALAAPAPSASPELPGWRFRNRDGGVWVVKPPAGDEWAVFQNTPAYALIEAIHAAKPSASPAVLTDEQIMKCLVEVRWSNNDAWCIDRIRHLLAASPADQGWQPIETAPKDGTEILLTNGKTVAEGQWCDEEPSIREYRDADGRWIDQQESDGFEGWMDWSGGMKPDPTHWMPLPPAPAMSATPPAGERGHE